MRVPSAVNERALCLIYLLTLPARGAVRCGAVRSGSVGSTVSGHRGLTRVEREVEQFVRGWEGLTELETARGVDFMEVEFDSAAHGHAAGEPKRDSYG